MPLDKTFLSLLRSPDDNSPLTQIDEHTLESSKEQFRYTIEQGIPILYGEQVDLEHLHEEEELAQMMRREHRSAAEQFSRDEWNKSKTEFWEKVHSIVAKQNKPQRILYIGCGYDIRAHEFTKNGHSFVNFDLIKEMIFEQQQQSKNNTNVVGDINALPFAPESFDIVICIDIIHHEYYTIDTVLKHIAALVKKNGFLFVEDPNAWALYQMPKTLLLPKPLYRVLRSAYHNIKKSSHKPAEYEFPTSIFAIKRLLQNIGFDDIEVVPQYAYPERPRFLVVIYRFLSKIDYIARYHNFHYLLVGRKKGKGE